MIHGRRYCQIQKVIAFIFWTLNINLKEKWQFRLLVRKKATRMPFHYCLPQAALVIRSLGSRSALENVISVISCHSISYQEIHPYSANIDSVYDERMDHMQTYAVDMTIKTPDFQISSATVTWDCSLLSYENTLCSVFRHSTCCL